MKHTIQSNVNKQPPPVEHWPNACEGEAQSIEIGGARMGVVSCQPEEPMAPFDLLAFIELAHGRGLGTLRLRHWASEQVARIATLREVSLEKSEAMELALRYLDEMDAKTPDSWRCLREARKILAGSYRIALKEPT